MKPKFKEGQVVKIMPLNSGMKTKVGIDPDMIDAAGERHIINKVIEPEELDAPVYRIFLGQGIQGMAFTFEEWMLKGARPMSNKELNSGV